jgi:predicted hotdog family 3-hydroxylacyl-ACP dehydratase
MSGNGATSAFSLPRPAEGLLPHRPPMLFVEALLARDGARSTVRAVLPESGICMTNNRLLPECLVELIAQAAALASGYDAYCLGKPAHGGMLVGVDGFSFHGRAIPGRAVRIETEMKLELGALKMIHGKVYDDLELLAAGDIKVWEDLGPNATR